MIRTTILSLAGMVFLAASSGCEICGDGAVCDGRDYDEKEHGAREKCIEYCGRLSVCGAPQTEDLQDCVDACIHRFEVLPKKTAELVECAETSRCSDVVEGRCTNPSSTGGGGATNVGDSSPNAGGATNVGGAPPNGAAASPGTPAGGTSASGGAPTVAPAAGFGGAIQSGGAATCSDPDAELGGEGGVSAGGGGESSCSCPVD